MNAILLALANGSLPAPAFVPVTDKALRGMDQKLGYLGKQRLVYFYYESRGEEVIWRDTRSYGFATGAWSIFMDEVVPLAERYQADLGYSGLPARHVLLVDRTDRRNYFAEKSEAARLLGEMAEAEKQAEAAENAIVQPSTVSVEIMRETITRLAYEIWEKKGRPEGEYLNDWLEAESKLRTGAPRSDSAG